MFTSKLSTSTMTGKGTRFFSFLPFVTGNLTFCNSHCSNRNTGIPKAQFMGQCYLYFKSNIRVFFFFFFFLLLFASHKLHCS